MVLREVRLKGLEEFGEENPKGLLFHVVEADKNWEFLSCEL